MLMDNKIYILSNFHKITQILKQFYNNFRANRSIKIHLKTPDIILHGAPFKFTDL